MHRLHRAVRFISGLWLMLMLGTGTALANGIPTFSSQLRALGVPRMGAIILSTYIATVVVEYGVLYLFLRRLMTPGAWLLPWVLLVNLVTNPVAQLVWIYFKDWLDPLDHNLLLYGIELAVVAVEFLLFRWIFGRMCDRSALAAPVTERRTLTIVLAANVASFLFAAAG